MVLGFGALDLPLPSNPFPFPSIPDNDGSVQGGFHFCQKRVCQASAWTHQRKMPNQDFVPI